jgi:hypothetical protein
LGQEIGDRRKQLSHFHQRPFGAAQGLAQCARKRLLICACYTGGDCAGDIRADRRHTADARSDAISLWIFCVSHRLVGMVNVTFI